MFQRALKGKKPLARTDPAPQVMPNLSWQSLRGNRVDIGSGILTDSYGQREKPKPFIPKEFRLLVHPCGFKSGGDEGDRTPGLRIANAALSQLSYIPVPWQRLALCGRFSSRRRKPFISLNSRDRQAYLSRNRHFRMAFFGRACHPDAARAACPARNHYSDIQKALDKHLGLAAVLGGGLDHLAQAVKALVLDGSGLGRANFHAGHAQAAF